MINKNCNCSAPIQKQCLKLIDLYMEEIIDMFVKDYTPEQVCAELHLCPPKIEEQIDNQINEVSSQVRFWISSKGTLSSRSKRWNERAKTLSGNP